MYNQADRSVVMTKSPRVAFLGHCPPVDIFSHTTVKASIILGPPLFRTSAGMLSTPGDLSFFSICTAFNTASFKIF